MRIAALGLCFALGALVDGALTWRLHERQATSTQPETGDAAAPVHPPIAPEPVEQPPEEPLVGHEGPAADTEPAVAGTTGIVSHDAAVDLLRERELTLPVEGIEPEELVDTFLDARGGNRVHEAIDIMAPRHTPIYAVDNGTIAKLFPSQGGGGVTIYQFDASGAFCYYYAHLERYAAGLREGQTVRRGELIGYVGSSGNASPDAPHLHFAIYRLLPERRWWQGEPVNPYEVLGGGA